jgi:hypothetical protein
MKSKKLFLMAALSLIMSALTVQAAPTRIVAPQTNITVPGSYVLANDISGSYGIEISVSDVTLDLNGHTITAQETFGVAVDQSVLNAHVSNGHIVAGEQGVLILGSSCLFNELNIKIIGPYAPIVISYGSFNRVQNCVLSATGQAFAAFSLYLTSHNTIQNNTLAGVFADTILGLKEA